MRAPLASFTLAAAMIATLGAGLGGCVGNILGGGDGGGTPPDPVVPDEPREVCADGKADVAGPRLLRRLTGPELAASVYAGFGITEAEWKGGFLPPDPAGKNGFTNNVDRLRVSDSYARNLHDTVVEIANVVTGDAVVKRILPCASTGGEACVATFLDTFGRRLYRRPLTEAERGRYLALFQKVAADGGLFTDWMRWATMGLLQSPSFLYRSELGEGGNGSYTLTGYEVATALSFSLTGKPPGDGLLDLAGAGKLEAPADIERAARDLVVDAQDQIRADFRGVFLQFANQWLGLSTLANLQKSPAAVPGYTDAVRASMLAELNRYVSHVAFDERGGVAALLTSPVTYVDRTLATYYGFGLADAAAGSERPAGWGVGLLAQGALLSIYASNEATSPVRRGALIQRKLLCFDPPPPPPVVGDLPVPTGKETTRQRYELHDENPTCRGCHQYMDPIGFGFEHLDAGGRFRDTENSLAIDDSGVLRAGSAEVPFKGPTELATALADRPETSECVASYLASYAYGLDHHDTTCLVSSLTADLRDKDLGFVDFYLRLTQTRHFAHRVD